jgi:hypothetical protein
MRDTVLQPLKEVGHPSVVDGLLVVQVTLVLPEHTNAAARPAQRRDGVRSLEDPLHKTCQP